MQVVSQLLSIFACSKGDQETDNQLAARAGLLQEVYWKSDYRQVGFCLSASSVVCPARTVTY